MILMKKKNFGLQVLLGLSIILFGTSTDSDDVIYWSSDYKLTWDDFEGEPRFDYESISALTSSGIIHYMEKSLLKYKLILKKMSHG
jgi:hypothetical protein